MWTSVKYCKIVFVIPFSTMIVYVRETLSELYKDNLILWPTPSGM